MTVIGISYSLWFVVDDDTYLLLFFSSGSGVAVGSNAKCIKPIDMEQVKYNLQSSSPHHVMVHLSHLHAHTHTHHEQ